MTESRLKAPRMDCCVYPLLKEFDSSSMLRNEKADDKATAPAMIAFRCFGDNIDGDFTISIEMSASNYEWIIIPREEIIML